jgi:serine phosphatase RsbU (regulator of sigma subunit)
LVLVKKAKQREEKFWCSSRDQYFLRSSESQSLKVVRPYDNMKERERERKEKKEKRRKEKERGDKGDII